jgi:SAM-dependent methyltransferase
MTTSETNADELRESVRRHYAGSALAVMRAEARCCGGESAGSQALASEGGAAFYDAGQREVLPDAAVLASLGCGNPTAVAELREGETVLDLGSGGGIDVLLSARRVGPSGKAYGLDMTDEMLGLARARRPHRPARRPARRWPLGRRRR